MASVRALLRALSLLLFLSCISQACSGPSQATEPPPLATWMLGERFAIGVVSCRVAEARTRLTEPRKPPGLQRVAPDVHVLSVTLACETADGNGISPQRALPAETVILLSSADGRQIAPSTRTWLSEEQPDLLVFEVQAQDTFVARTRRFDAATGQRKTPIDARMGVLLLQTPQQKIAVMLRERAADLPFEQAVNVLMVKVAQGGTEEAGERAAHVTHRAIVAHTQARTVSLQPQRAADGALDLTLFYDDASQIPSPALRTLRLALAPSAASASLRVKSVHDLDRIERALSCEREREELRARATQAYSARTQTGDCHVLGLLLPGPCDGTDPALLGRALDVLSRCIEPHDLRAKHAPPADFQLTLRRGRTGSALDRAPRYTLALFAAGEVVFHGRHWVNTLGRSDGRTHPQLLAGLYAHMLSLEWFDRKGGEWSAEACSTDDEQGNVITLHAGERKRMIVDRPGCRGPFREHELDALRVLIETAAGISSFTQERALYADREARVWTVE